MNDYVFEHTLPVQCSCLASKPHTRNENVLLWSTRGICKEQERRKKNEGEVCAFFPSSANNVVKQKVRP